MKEINYNSIYANLPSFTGLPIHAKGRRYIGQCYYSGQRHKSRRDKLTCYMKGGKIWLVEQGEQPIDLWFWMLEYGGYSSDLEVGNALREESGNTVDIPAFVEPEPKYVYESTMNKTLHKYSDTLFTWLCKLFPQKAVKEAYDLYKIGSIGDEVCFWMIKSDGRIGHDKIMKYDPETGKRDKNKLPCRRFKVDHGFTSAPLFGGHLVDKFKDSKIYAVESEKTAILFYLYYGKICVATSSASCLNKTDPSHILLGDYDKAGSRWWESGGIDWWHYYKEEISEGDDIGDVIVKLIKKKI